MNFGGLASVTQPGTANIEQFSQNRFETGTMKSSIQNADAPQSQYSTFNPMSAEAMHTKVSFGEFVTLMWAIEADLIKK